MSREKGDHTLLLYDGESAPALYHGDDTPAAVGGPTAACTHRGWPIRVPRGGPHLLRFRSSSLASAVHVFAFELLRA